MSNLGTEAFSAFIFALFITLLLLAFIAGGLAKGDADYLDLYHLDRERWEELRRRYYGG